MSNFEKQPIEEQPKPTPEKLGESEQQEAETHEKIEAPKKPFFEQLKEAPEKVKELYEQVRQSPELLRTIGKQLYDTVGTVLGTKFMTDLVGALRKKGDIYNYFKQKGEVKEEKEEISQALDELIIVARERKQEWGALRRKEQVDVSEKMSVEGHERLKNATTVFKEKIKEAKSLPEAEKKMFQKRLAEVMAKHRK